MRAPKRRRRASGDGVTRRDHTSSRGEPPRDDHECRRSSSSRGLDKDGYVQVKLADIRDKVQCPICLGIIQNTRAVIECLHRFCRECVANFMLLRSNECPACHTRCGSNSLRADTRYDALIEAFYPNAGKSKESASLEKKMTWKNQPETKAQGRDRITAKASKTVFVRRSQVTPCSELSDSAEGSDEGKNEEGQEQEEEMEVEDKGKAEEEKEGERAVEATQMDAQVSQDDSSDGQYAISLSIESAEIRSEHGKEGGAPLSPVGMETES